ncbi:ABC transporter substrate-binding protein [Sanguibacter antarcticus]|uniref:Carbohydrate ABC transporter substrate-binding protein (CUT1 family) n=1 Tax=Sanguibacter antarcticus TaxID=372484 RepID=A0A2A9E445_9MICO|nr:extracellular solute-binding protein [Sanguibacter antarcticus]PFG33012.1 carbohydrate ABC transporter substrate-binding protein (CUT1 family) [Sanguibacter antarcticus]
MDKNVIRTMSAGVAVGAMLLVAGCSSSDSSDEAATSPDTTTVWTTAGTDDVLEASATRWNADHPDGQIDVQIFENDPYKTKLRTAISAGQGPTVFSGWGGGGLKTYVDAGEVTSLQSAFDAAPDLLDRIFPSVLAGGTVDGEIYGTPYNGVQPVVIYYNKDVFEQAGVEVPATWDDLLTAVGELNDAGVAPFSVGGASKWPYLMWIAYLTDRIGGPEVFQSIVDGEEDAWLDPAVIEANTMIQELVTAGGFVDGFSSVDANQGAAEALVYTGKAAMQLQGAWAYSGTYLTAAPDFVESGSLGWTTFPTVEGGAGDPANVTGNLSSYFSISEGASEAGTANATDWLLNGVFDDTYVDELMATGAVPPISGFDDKIAASSAPEWNAFVYTTAQAAGSFQLSWDQALDANQAEALLTNLEKVFLFQSTPQEFSDAMNTVAQEG